MLPPWAWPAIISAASTGLNYLSDRQQRSKLEGFQFPDPKFGLQKQNLLSQVGENVGRQGRATQRAMSARGLSDSGLSYAAGRSSAEAGQKAALGGLAQIQEMENQYNLQKASFDFQKRLAMDAATPNFGAYLSQALGTFASIYKLANPELFVSQLPQVGGGTPIVPGSGTSNIGIQQPTQMGGNPFIGNYPTSQAPAQQFSQSGFPIAGFTPQIGTGGIGNIQTPAITQPTQPSTPQLQQGGGVGNGFIQVGSNYQKTSRVSSELNAMRNDVSFRNPQAMSALAEIENLEGITGGLYELIAMLKQQMGLQPELQMGGQVYNAY